MSDVLINPARVRRVKPLSAEEVGQRGRARAVDRSSPDPKARVGGYS